SQSDPSGERYQHQRRFAEAEVGSPTPQIQSQFLHRRFYADALFARRVMSRIRCLNRSKAFGAIARWISGLAVKPNPRNFRFCGRATALFAAFTLSLSLCVMRVRRDETTAGTGFPLHFNLP